MTAAFQLAGGTVAGREHRKGVPRNRQDDFAIRKSAFLTTAVVCDGCGSGNRNEVGASIAVQLLNESLHREIRERQVCDERVLHKVRTDLLSQMHVLARNLGQSYVEIVANYLLFTILGIVITERETMVFGLGDGVFAVNGQVSVLEPTAGNRPIYLGYALTGSELTDDDPSLLKLQIHRLIPTEELHSFLLGTDGVSEIASRSQETIPGSEEPIGQLEQFWQEDRFFRNPACIERRLNLIARDWTRSLPNGERILEGGKLSDDTTLVVGRRLAGNPPEGDG